MSGRQGDPEQANTAPATKRVPTPVQERSHRWHWFAGRSHQFLDEVAGVLTATMSEDERAETLAELTRLGDRLDAIVATLVADDAMAAGELRGRTRITAATARRVARRAAALQRHPEVQQALAGGEIHLDQADVITHVIDKLPEEVAHLTGRAREVMLELAGDHDAHALKNLANHLLEVIAPELADELLARQLDKEERDARRGAYLKMHRDGHGSTYGKFKIPDRHGHLLDTFLTAIANPQRPDAIDRANRDLPEVKGAALCELLERINVHDLPKTGGSPVTVIVTMTLDTLTGGLRPAGILGTDLQVSPSEARRLAARHGVIPVVLGGLSEVLDVGRRRRYFTRAQRVAMAIRQDGLCNITGCDIPASWCDGNHRVEWQHGGRTDLQDGELVCPQHHTDIHLGIRYTRRT